MKLALLYTHLILIFSLAASAETLQGRVVVVSNGDTVTVLRADNAQHRVLLVKIDATEADQPYSSGSKQILSNLVYGKWQTNLERKGRRLNLS